MRRVRARLLWRRSVHPAHDGEKESRGPTAHQDARERLNATDQTPRVRQHEVAVAGGRISHHAEVQRRLHVGHPLRPGIAERPERHFHHMEKDDPARDADEHPHRGPEGPIGRRGLALHPAKRCGQPNRMHGDAQGHQAPRDEQSQKHQQFPLGVQAQ